MTDRNQRCRSNVVPKKIGHAAGRGGLSGRILDVPASVATDRARAVCSAGAAELARSTGVVLNRQHASGRSPS